VRTAFLVYLLLCLVQADSTQDLATAAKMRTNRTAATISYPVGWESSHPLLSMYSEESGLAGNAGFTSPDPLAPIDLAFDGSLFTFSGTTEDCNGPCVMAIQLLDPVHISRITLWNGRNNTVPVDYTSLPQPLIPFTDIDIELVLRDPSKDNTLNYNVGQDGRTVYKSNVFAPSAGTTNATAESNFLVYRNIDLDLTGLESGGVIANYIRIRRNNGPGRSQLKIAEVDIHAAIPVPCSYGQWGPWSACTPPCSNTAGQVSFQTRTRSIISDASLGGTPCSKNDTIQVNQAACSGSFLPACPNDCSWSMWADWSSCSVICGGGSGTATRFRAKLGPAPGGQNCDGTTMDTKPCTASTTKCPEPTNPCAALRGFGRQKCQDSKWTVNPAEELVAPIYFKFDGSLRVQNSLVIIGDSRILGDLILFPGATLTLLQGGNLRVDGNVELNYGANISISHSSLMVGGTFHWNGTVQQRSMDSFILVENLAYLESASLDLSFVQGADTSICTFLGYTTIALYRSLETNTSFNELSDVYHACDFPEGYHFVTQTLDHRITTAIFVPIVNTTSVPIGAIVGGVVAGVLIVALIIGGLIYYSVVYDDVYKDLGPDQGVSDYLISEADIIPEHIYADSL